MTDDLIRRQDAINAIRTARKRICTAARKLGYAESIDILTQLPSAKALTVTMAEPVTQSAAGLHSFWFYNAGWWFCDN